MVFSRWQQADVTEKCAISAPPPPDLSNFLLPPKEILHAGCSGKLSQPGAGRGSGRAPSCSTVPLRVQSPPGPGTGCDLLKDGRIWPQGSLSSSMLNKASQEGVGAVGAAVCSSWALPAPLLAPPCLPHHIPSPHIRVTPCITPGQEPASAKHQRFTPSAFGYTNLSLLPSSQQSVVSFQWSGASRG